MNIVTFISSERLKTYTEKTDREKKAIALHNQTLQLGSSLMAMIALIELSLRNITNAQLIADFGDDEWLVAGHATLPLKTFEKAAISKARSHAQKAAYSKLSYKQKNELDKICFPGGVPEGTTHKAVAKRRQSTFEPTHGQIIAQTTLVLWKRFYSHEYHATLWKQSLRKIFPNKSIKRSDVSSALEKIYAARNRVAHHEPVYGEKLDELIEAISFIRNSIGSRTETDDTSFKRFSNLHYLRLKTDYATFIEAWHTLT